MLGLIALKMKLFLVVQIAHAIITIISIKKGLAMEVLIFRWLIHVST
jgi:hypothetical protein